MQSKTVNKKKKKRITDWKDMQINL